MNLKLTLITVLSIMIFLLRPSGTVVAADSASSSTDLDVITENVKKRIQEVARDHITTPPSTSTVYFGNLQNFTDNTLSILTGEGVKLASISADTLYYKLPSYKTISQNDIPIDSYVIAVGFPQPEKVLDTTKVFTQDASPVDPTDKTAYGTVLTYDPKKFLLTLQNPKSGEEQQFLVSKKAALNRWVSDGTKDPLKRSDPMEPGTPVLVIYLENGGPNNENLAMDVLLKSNSL